MNNFVLTMKLFVLAHVRGLAPFVPFENLFLL